MGKMVNQNEPLENWSRGERQSAGACLQLPLASGEDLARLRHRTPSGVHASVRRLRTRGVVTSVRAGCLRPQTERLILADEGSRQLESTPTSWHQPAYLIRSLDRLPSVEFLYSAAVGVTDLGGFCEWQWADGVGFDAAVRYEEGWVVFFWVGPLRLESRFLELVEQMGQDLEEYAVGNARPRPSLVCCVVYDQYQAEMVLGVARRLGMAQWVRVWCVADDSWRGADGHLIGRGWVRQPAYRRKAGRLAWERCIQTTYWVWESNLDLAQNLAWMKPSFAELPASGSIVKLMDPGYQDHQGGYQGLNRLLGRQRRLPRKAS